MDEFEELKQLRAQFGTKPPIDEVDEYEQLKKEFGSTNPQEPQDFLSTAPARAWGTLASPIVAASQFVDKYVGAPVRSGLRKLQEPDTGLSDFGEAFGQQFGEDPTKAPTYSDIVAKAGVPTEKNIPFPSIKNFGSPNARFQETKISPADVAGTAIGFGTDPANLIPAVTASKAVARGVEAISGVGKGVVKPTLRKAGSWVTSVSPDDFNYYTKHHGRLKGQKADITGLYGSIQDDVEKIRNRAEKAEIEHSNAKGLIDQDYQAAKLNLSPQALLNYPMVQDLQQVILKDKMMQGDLSKLADDELAKLPIIGDKNSLIKMIDKEIRSIDRSTSVGDEAARALEREKSLVDANMASYLNGPQMRDWLQNFRSLADYQNKNSPVAYNSIFDKAVKNIGETVQNNLKNLSDSKGMKYRELQESSHNLLKATEKVNELFESDAKGFSTLTKLIASNKQADRDLIANTLKEWANVRESLPNGAGKGTKEMVDELIKQFDDIRDDLAFAGMQKKDYFATPETKEKLMQTEFELRESKKAVQDTSLFGSKSLENTIKRLGSHEEPPIRYQEQLKALDDLTGIDYGQTIRDQGVLRKFDLPGPRTGFITTPSAMVGTAIGGAIGGPEGGMVGAGLGAAAGVGIANQAGKGLRGAIDVSMSTQDALKKVSRALQNPNSIRGNFAKYSVKLADYAAKFGMNAALVYHQLLFNSDPEYRAALAEMP
jgi:hypothetical protein